MRDREFLPKACRARLLLDYGLDEQTCEDGIRIDERGMRFISKWQFSLGTNLAINCEYRHPEHGWGKVRLEGIVVWNERIDTPKQQCPAFETTVLFLELPDELRQCVREFSSLLVGAE
jgi:hypothetical protein